MVISIQQFACNDCMVDVFGSSQVFASVHVVTQPTDLTKVIEVELNDDYFNPNVITIPLEGSTTLLLKNKGKTSTPLQ